MTVNIRSLSVDQNYMAPTKASKESIFVLTLVVFWVSPKPTNGEIAWDLQQVRWQNSREDNPLEGCPQEHGRSSWIYNPPTLGTSRAYRELERLFFFHGQRKPNAPTTTCCGVWVCVILIKRIEFFLSLPEATISTAYSPSRWLLSWLSQAADRPPAKQ